MFTSRLLNVVTAIVLVAVLMLTIREAVATNSIVADIEAASRSPYIHNPELKVADRFSAENEASSGSNLFVTNPELSIAQRFNEHKREAVTTLAENPELSAANRYASSADRSGESTLLSINPELSVAWRYSAERTRE